MTSRAVAVALLAITLVGGASGQDKKQEGAEKGMPDMQEMMKKWKDYMTPGEPHRMLADMAGSWTIETKNWMAGPGSEPSISKGTAEMKMVLGGRYLQQEIAGEMMNMPFNGMGLTGYDNFKKKYVGFWVDNMGTGMATMEGEMEGDGKTCTYWGVMDEPTTGEKNKKVKYVLTKDSPDQYHFRIFDVAAFGEKDPVMEITYNRAH